jgi:hypothetical protein
LAKYVLSLENNACNLGKERGENIGINHIYIKNNLHSEKYKGGEYVNTFKNRNEKVHTVWRGKSDSQVRMLEKVHSLGNIPTGEHRGRDKLGQ